MHRHVQDDSGARVRRRIDEQIRKAVWRSRPKAQRRAADIRRGLKIYAALAVLGVPFFLVMQGMSWFLKPNIPQWAFTPVSLTVIASLFVALCPIACRLLWRGERGWCLVMRCCPACNYDMSGLTTRDDGLTVCPECGAAWRLDG